jgi:hypothetical protein
MKVYAGWNEVALALGAPVPTAAELAQGLDRTWQCMADCLARWSPADMHQTFPDNWDGKQVDVSRAWVVCMCWSMTCTTVASSRSPSACTGSRRISPARACERLGSEEVWILTNSSARVVMCASLMESFCSSSSKRHMFIPARYKLPLVAHLF